jgi:PKD repeat protein
VPVTFDGSGSSDPGGSIAAYWWQFGDGGSATVSTATVSHTYTATGTYTVTLWVRDNLGMWSLASDTATATISTGTTTTTSATPTTSTSTLPNQPPVANAGPDQFTQTLTTITLNGSSSSDPDGTIALASWNFGDGTTGAGLTVTHSYATAGTYTATLSVIDDDGSLDTDTATITVANRPPTAEAGPDTGGAPNSMINLNGSASSDPDGTIVGWAWAFGDGTTGSGPTPSHAYATTGTYTATLTVTDNNGANAADTTSVVVSNTSTPWARALGSTTSDASYGTAVDAAGNVVVTGTYRGTVDFGGASKTSAGGADWFVAKYSPTGALLWVHSMGGTGDDSPEAVAVAASTGDVVVGGRFTGSAAFGGAQPLVANGTSDMAVAKYRASDGVHQWSKRFGGVYDDTISAVAVDGSANVYLTGYFRGTVDFGGGPLSVPFTTDLDVFVVKLDGAGGHLWSKNFTNDGNERGYGIAVDGSGNVAVTGYFSNTVNFGGGALTSLNAMTDIFVARFTTAGAHSWSKRFGASDGNESGYAAAMDSSGNVVVAGYLQKAADLGGGSLAALGGADGFVAKYAATSGAHQWSRRVGGTANDYAYGVTVDPGTNVVYVTGSFEDVAGFGGTSLTAAGSSDVFVAKYGATGTPTWATPHGGSSADVGRAIQFRAGTLAASGYFFGSGTFEGIGLTASGTAADAFAVRMVP